MSATDQLYAVHHGRATPVVDVDCKHKGTPAPSAAYDGCELAEEVSERYKQVLRAYADENHGGNLNAVSTKAMMELGEDSRRAYVRAVVLRDHGGHVRRVLIPKVSPPEEGPDGWVIVCVECGEPKPANKFPTIGPSEPGVRHARCRDCRKEANARGEQ